MGGYKGKRSLNDDLKIAGLSDWKDGVDIYLNEEDCKESKSEGWERPRNQEFCFRQVY